jgi:hypothetical protein
LPSEDYGEVASANDPIGWKDVNDNIIESDIVITEDIDLYAFYE